MPDVELVRERAQADSLCKATPGAWATVPPPDAGGEACPHEGERFVCRSGMVYACPSASSVPVAVCTNGCADDGETVADTSVDIASATQLMCVHDRRVTGP